MGSQDFVSVLSAYSGSPDIYSGLKKAPNEKVTDPIDWSVS